MLRGEFAKANVDKAIAAATEKVGKLKAESKPREYFDGKLVLRESHKNYVNKSGMSREIFIYQCAREANKRRSVEKFVTDLFEVVGVTSTRPLQSVRRSRERPHKGAGPNLRRHRGEASAAS